MEKKSAAVGAPLAIVVLCREFVERDQASRWEGTGAPVCFAGPAGPGGGASGPDGSVLTAEKREGVWRFRPGLSIASAWLLLVGENEGLQTGDVAALRQRLATLPATPHQVCVRRLLEPGKVARFDWVTTRRIFNSPEQELRAFHVTEPRLVPSGCLEAVRWVFSGDRCPGEVSVLTEREPGGPGESALLPLNIEVLEPSGPEDGWAPPEDREIFIHGHERFFNDRRLLEEFEWPRTIYALIRSDHIPVIFKGLEKGLTSPGIVLYALKYLLAMADTARALELTRRIPPHWEIHSTVVQMKALTYICAGKPEEAKNLIQRSALSLSHDPQAIENIGKFSLLLGERDEAMRCFQRALEKADPSQEDNHLRTFLEILQGEVERTPTLTVCILCRDEEQFLARALESVNGLADEVVVADTGSVDGSVQVAERLGARVFHLPWNDDFSLARNKALEHCTCDYVMMLDADEYLFTLDFVDFLVMKRLLPLRTPRAFALPIGHLKVETDWINVLAGGGNFIVESHCVRLVPRLASLRYEGRVEESPAASLEAANILVTTLPERQMRIHHDVLSRHHRAARKLAVYGSLDMWDLTTAVAAVRDHSLAGDREGTVRWLTRLVDMGVREGFSPVVPMGIRLAALLEEETPERALQVLERLAEKMPGDPRILTALSSHHIRHGRLERLASLTGGGGPESSASGALDVESMVHRALWALEKEELGEAASRLDRVLSQRPGDLLGQAARFYLLCKVGDAVSASAALEDILELAGGEKTGNIEEPMVFLQAVEKAAGRLDKWGHGVERSLLLHGALLLENALEEAR